MTRNQLCPSGTGGSNPSLSATLSSLETGGDTPCPYMIDTNLGRGLSPNAGELRKTRSARAVTPEKVGVQKILKRLDSVFRRNDDNGFRTVGGRLKSQALGLSPPALRMGRDAHRTTSQSHETTTSDPPSERRCPYPPASIDFTPRPRVILP